MNRRGGYANSVPALRSEWRHVSLRYNGTVDHRAVLRARHKQLETDVRDLQAVLNDKNNKILPALE